MQVKFFYDVNNYFYHCLLLLLLIQTGISKEVFFRGVPSPLSKLKHLKSLRGAPKKEGIMGAKRLEGPTDYDWAEEWLRNRR